MRPLIALSLLAVAAPSATAAVYKDRAKGYQLRVNTADEPTGTTLTIPKKRAGIQSFYYVYCAPEPSKKGDLLMAASPLSGQRTLRAPSSSFSRSRLACRLTLDDSQAVVARFKLRRA